jgi:PAS domain S-box-containing protein
LIGATNCFLIQGIVLSNGTHLPVVPYRSLFLNALPTMPELDRSNDYYRQLADALPQIVWTSNPEGELDYYNQRWFDYTGMTLEQTYGWGWKPVLHPDDVQACIERWTQSYTTGEAYEIQYRFLRASDQTYRWHLGRALPILDSTGKIVKWFGTCTDINDQKEVEANLAKSEAHLQAMADAMPHIVWSAGADGVLTTLNKQWYLLTGIDPKNFKNFDWVDLIHPDDILEIAEQREKSIVNGTAYEFKYRMRFSRNGDYRWVLGRGIPVRDESGMITGWFGTTTDITDVMQQEEVRMRLEVDRDLALEAVRVRSEFLANMSHEIRTPLNGIVGMTEFIGELDQSDEVHDAMKLVRESSEALLTIVNDILDISKIESIEMDVQSVLFSAVELLRPRAEAKKIYLLANINGEVPHILIGDPHRLKQVLLNLVSNAVKFTSRGEVHVSLSVLSQTDSRCRLVIAVEDTGIGIVATAIPTLFNPFTQADNSTTRRFGGTGLGLAISHRLLQAMGSELTVISAPAEGSTFTFELNLTIPTESEKGEGLASSATEQNHERVNCAGSVLIAEDNLINQQLLLRILERLNVHAEIAETGVEVLMAVRKHDYSLVLMDCQMPDMDGYETTRVIRRQEGGGRHLPIVALTANAMKGDRERCLECGMDDYLSKPYQMSQIKEMLVRYAVLRADE